MDKAELVHEGTEKEDRRGSSSRQVKMWSTERISSSGQYGQVGGGQSNSREGGCVLDGYGQF